MKKRQIGNIVVLTPKGFLVGGEETTELEQAIQGLSASNKDLLINLGEVQDLRSEALVALISAHSNYVRRGGRMRLCSVNKRIENIFVITNLSLVFDVYPNEKQGIASFAGRESTAPRR